MSLQKNIKLLTWFNFFTDFKLYAPIAIIYFAEVSHSYALGASIFSIAYIASAIFEVPTGIYSDIIGRKKTIILGAVFAVLFTVFYAIAGNYWFLVVGAIFEGLSRAFYSGNNNALLHNMLSEEGVEHEFHTYSGKLGSMFQIALGISAVLGALIANWSFVLVMWISVIPQIVCLLISFQIVNTKKTGEKTQNIINLLKDSIRGFKENYDLRLLSISNILSYGMGEGTYQFQAAFYNTVWPIWAVGVAKMLSNASAAASFYFSGKIIDKLGAIKILIIDDIYSKISNIIALLFPTFISPLLMSSSGLFFGVSTTAELSLLQKEFSEKQRATMSSLNSLAGSLFFGIFIYFIGVFADKFGPAKSLLFVQILSIGVVFLHWKLYTRAKKKAYKG